jgi:hypothetical protein
MPRTRGAASGLLIVILGAWGAAIPFVGHYLHLVVGPDRAFDMTPGRFWLSLVPGVVAVLGGLMLVRSRNRATATLGAQLALAAGVWFVVGRSASLLWSSGGAWGGAPMGGATRQAIELLAYYFGVGAAITALAGIALGRVSARHAGDVERLTTVAPAAGPAPRAGEPVEGAESADAVDDTRAAGRHGGRFRRRTADREKSAPPRA